MVRAPRGFRFLFLATAFALVAVWVAVAQKVRSVDDIALKNAGKSGEEWITYNQNWAEQRYSRLNQINATNISRLGLAWSYDIPTLAVNGGHQEGTPLVFDGVIYSISAWSVVYALDARTGKELWRQDPQVDRQVWQSRICCGVVNRGLALYRGKVIAPAIDGRLRALEAASGKVLWETRVSPENMAYTITMAPRVIKGGKVIVGVSGGEYAVRGFFSAYDAETGNLAWRFYTVPGDPSKPFEHPDLAAAAKTWSGEWWKIGGGAAVWGGVAYDPDTDLVYVGTGQPGPWTEVSRGPGDNLYANSIVVVHGATGKLAWYYQEVTGDNWDYDSIADLMLLDLKIKGKTRKVVIHAPKDGFFYVLDRVTGELISAEPFTKVSWSSGIDMKTGRPIVNQGARYGTSPVSVMPGPAGGHVWAPWSFNPATGLVYIPGTSGTTYSFQAIPNFVPTPPDIGPTGRGQTNMGTGFARGAARGGAAAPPPVVDPGAAAGEGGQVHREVATPAAPPTETAASGKPPALPTIGPEGATGNVLFAWDPVAQKGLWRGLSAGPFSGGSLSTAGNLVFSSVNSRLLAYRADTGEVLLDLQTGLSQLGPPMTFMLDGKQYIAVAGGPGSSGSADPPPAGNSPTGGAPGGPTIPSARLLVLVLDGKRLMP
jgi:quinohemoprotein ethanol dehydrogenase